MYGNATGGGGGASYRVRLKHKVWNRIENQKNAQPDMVNVIRRTPDRFPFVTFFYFVSLVTCTGEFGKHYLQFYVLQIHLWRQTGTTGCWLDTVSQKAFSVALWSWWYLLLQGLTTKPRQKWGSHANRPPEPSETQRQNGKHTHSRFTKYLIKKESNEYYIKNQLNFSLPSSSNSPQHQSGLGILSLVPPVWPVGQQRFPCPFLSVVGNVWGSTI